MLFKPELAYKVLRGEKTETRRIVKEGQRLLDSSSGMAKGVYHTTVYGYYALDGMGQRTYFNGHKDRTVWQVGRDYPVQPGRGKKTLLWRPDDLGYNGVSIWEGEQHEELFNWGWRKGYLTVDDLWREDVRNISEASVKAEGFDKRYEFLLIWMSMHDKAGFKDYTDWARWQALARWTVDDAAKIAMEPEIAERVERIARAGDSALYDAWVIKFHRKESA